MSQINEMIDMILDSKNIVFLTGAGVSTLSGIPDYRSMTGVYANKDNPEYLLSIDCLNKEPKKFYDFIKQLYHPDAKPNIIHNTIKDLETIENVTVITQNIDGLHNEAKSSNVINFHGNIYTIYCRFCHCNYDVEDYLISDRCLEDNCQLRPDVVLYGEPLDENNIINSIKAIQEADTIVIVGTTFKVYPFASLIDYASNDTKILLINNDDVYNTRINYKYIGPAQDLFTKLNEKIKEKENV